jgi:kinetochore protein Nuf2
LQALKKILKSSSQLQLINEQVTNAKTVEKEFKALKDKLSEDGVAYKSLEAKVVERERIGKCWFISSFFRYCF